MGLEAVVGEEAVGAVEVVCVGGEEEERNNCLCWGGREQSRVERQTLGALLRSIVL